MVDTPSLPFPLVIGGLVGMNKSEVTHVRLTPLENEAIAAAKAPRQSKSSFILQAIHAKLALQPVKDKPDAKKSLAIDETNATTSPKIALPPALLAKTKMIAREQGFATWGRWARFVIEKAAGNTQQISPQLLAELQKINYELSAIGKNLNQYTRAANILMKETSLNTKLTTLEEVEEIAKSVSTYLISINEIVRKQGSEK